MNLATKLIIKEFFMGVIAGHLTSEITGVAIPKV